MKKWGLINAFLSRNAGLVVLSLFTGLLYNLFTVFVPLCLGRFYEFNFGFSSFRLRLLKDFKWINTPDFNQFLWFFAGVIVFRFLFEYVNRYAIAILGERFSRDLREELFMRQLKVKLPVYEEFGTGKYLLRFSGDLKSIQNYLTQGIFRFSQDLVLIGILLLVLAYYSIPVFSIISGFIALAFLFLFVLNRKLYQLSLERRDRKSGMLSYVSRSLQAIASVKAFNKEVPASKRYTGRSRKLYKVSSKYQAVVSLIHAVIPFLTYLMIGAVMYYLYRLKISNIAFDEASLLVIILLIISFLPIFRRMLRVNIAWKLGHISFTKLQKVFDLPSEMGSSADKTVSETPSLNTKGLQLDLNGNRFRFPDVTASPGQRTVLTYGDNRQKASVLIKLLTGLYQPTSGGIFLGDVPYSELSEKSIRRNTAVISDLFPLEGKSVFEAISYSRKAAKRKKAQKVLGKVNSFLPDDEKMELDNRIGEKGNKLSDRQRQLLNCARAILTGKPVLVLDEPHQYLNREQIAQLEKWLTQILEGRVLLYLVQELDGLGGYNEEYPI